MNNKATRAKSSSRLLRSLAKRWSVLCCVLSIFVLWGCTYNKLNYSENKAAPQSAYASATPTTEKLQTSKPQLKHGEHLPGIDSRLPVTVRSKQIQGDVWNYSPIVALTLDACGGRVGGNSDLTLLDFLEEKSIPVTFFITPGWVRHNPESFVRILNNPNFELALHGLMHRPCFVQATKVYGIASTASVEELVNEVWGGKEAIQSLMRQRELDPGRFNPRWFRSGTATYDEEAVKIIRAGALRIAGYSVSLDQGASLPEEEVYQRTIQAAPGDILLAHFNHPEKETGAGLIRGLSELLDKGVAFTTLSRQYYFFKD